MAYQPPIPESKTHGEPGRKSNSGIATLVQAERLMQIAMVLPCALVIGWLPGWGIDAHYHTHWATITGVALGLAAGLVSAVRMALAAGDSGGKKGGK